MSKARVAPIKPRTLPPMELAALELGTKLAHYHKSLLQIVKVYILIDSEIWLCWIRKISCEAVCEKKTLAKKII